VNRRARFAVAFIVVLLVAALSQAATAQQKPAHATSLNPATLGDTVLIAKRKRTFECTLGANPDRRCSPGSYYSQLRKAVICSPVFRTLPIPSVSQSEKFEVQREYELQPRPFGSSLEIDHIIPLELGGSNDISNLFPERVDAHPGYRPKDKLERKLRGLVCRGDMTLSAARREIAANWQRLYAAVFRRAPAGTLKLAASAKGKSSGREQARYITQISRSARDRTFGGLFTSWEESLDLRLPGRETDVQALRVNSVGSVGYDHALHSLLISTGLFAAEGYVYEPVEQLGKATVTVSSGVLHMVVDVGRRWRMRHDRNSLCFHLDKPPIRAEIPTVVELRLSGYDVRSVEPFPMSDDGHGDIAWLLRPNRPNQFEVCAAPASHNLATAIRTRADYWRLLYPPVDYWPLLAVFIVAAWIARKARQTPDVGRAAAQRALHAVLQTALRLTLLLIASWWVLSAGSIVGTHAARLRPPRPRGHGHPTTCGRPPRSRHQSRSLSAPGFSPARRCESTRRRNECYGESVYP
jgi:hypothetical protein